MDIQGICQAFRASGFHDLDGFNTENLSDFPVRLSLGSSFSRSAVLRQTGQAQITNPIKSLPPQGIVIDQPGHYAVTQDIIWKPTASGAAITIACSNVTLDLNSHKISLASDTAKGLLTIGVSINKLGQSHGLAHADTLDDLLRGPAKGVMSATSKPIARLISEIETLKISAVSVKNGTLCGFSSFGLVAAFTEDLSLSDLFIENIGNTCLDHRDGVVAGITIAASVAPKINQCTMTGLTGLCLGVFGTLVAGCLGSVVSGCTAKGLKNLDGVVTGHAAAFTIGLNVENCTAKDLQSSFYGYSNAPGRTVLGYLPNWVIDATYTNNTADAIIGSADDCHGMSLFYVNLVKVDTFTATNIVDGTQTNTGAKATGLEVYGNNVALKNVHVSDIQAICPQDLVATGISLWGTKIRLDTCSATNVFVTNGLLERSVKVGLGVGFGWAPDPRTPLSSGGANKVSYTSCSADQCQVGFDTWKHQNPKWTKCGTTNCDIPCLVQPLSATRRLVMNRASEAPTGMPIATTVHNSRSATIAPDLVTMDLPATLDHGFDTDRTSVAFPPRHAPSLGDVTGVSLPGLFSMAPEFDSEWWYYVGTVTTTSDQVFSVQIEILRNSSGFGIYDTDLYGSVVGLGWSEPSPVRAEDTIDTYLFSQGYGLGADLRTDVAVPDVSFALPYVQDNSFSAYFRPGVQVTDPRPGSIALKEGKASYTSLDYTGAPIQEATAQVPPAVGAPGATYVLRAQGAGFQRQQGTTDTSNTPDVPFDLALRIKDQRGTVMEGDNGYVGPAMFPGAATGFNNASYECAQPILQVKGGWIQISGTQHQVSGGTLWMDRQMLHADKTAKRPPVKRPQLTKAADLVAALSTPALGKATQGLYIGNWLGLSFDSGHAMALAVFWQEKTQQWQSGTALDHPPIAGFGNVYYPLSTPRGIAHAGPTRLHPKRSKIQTQWGFDINIATPETPQQSPHWTSDVSGITYATSWQIAFGSGLAIPGIGSKILLKANVANCENTLPGLIECFYEGAATIFDADGCTKIGHAFVEQMGYN